MRLYYVFGALFLLGFLQCTLAKPKVYKRHIRTMTNNEKDCPISQKTNAMALQSGLKIDCIGSSYISELNVTGNDGEVCATLYDQHIDKCMWQRACNLTVDVGDRCSEQLNVSYICRSRPKVYYMSSKRMTRPKNAYRSGHIDGHGHGSLLAERRLRLYRTHPEHFAFTIYRMNIGKKILTVVVKDADGNTRNFSFTGALTLSDDLSKRTVVISDIKPYNFSLSLSRRLSYHKSDFGICYTWMTWDPQQNKEKFDTCKNIPSKCLVNWYYNAMNKKRAKQQERLNAKIGAGECHLTMDTTKTALQKTVTVDCKSSSYKVVNLTVTGKNGEMCTALKDRRSGKVYCKHPSKCRVKAGLLKTCPEELRINFACVSSVHVDCLSNDQYTRKTAGVGKESCSENVNTNKTNLQKGVLIRCFKSGLRDLSVTGEGGKTCATLKDQPFQKCTLQNACLLKANLTTECSEQLKVSYVCNDYPKGYLRLYDIAKSRKKSKKLKWVTHGRYHYSNASEGFIKSDVAYGKKRMTSETHPASNVIIRNSHGTELQHFAITVFSMNIGAERLSVVAEDVNGVTMEFSFTGALTLSDDISKRTRVISDIKPRNVTVFLSGLQSEDNSLGFILCYKWINWDSKMDEETFDTCQHFTRKCRYHSYFKGMMKKRRNRFSFRKHG